MKKYVSDSPAKTVKIGKEFTARTGKGSLICLYGELGSGKTTFVKGIAQEIDIKEEITSPTYVLLKRYEGIIPLHHIDLFRIEGRNEFIEAGLDDYLIETDGLVVIEWAGRISEILPGSRYDIEIDYLNENGSKRKIRISRPLEGKKPLQ